MAEEDIQKPLQYSAPSSHPHQPPPPGIKPMCDYYRLPIKKDKKIGTSDWNAKKLSDAQIEYASEDAWYTLIVARRAQKDLKMILNSPELSDGTDYDPRGGHPHQHDEDPLKEADLLLFDTYTLVEVFNRVFLTKKDKRKMKESRRQIVDKLVGKGAGTNPFGGAGASSTTGGKKKKRAGRNEQHGGSAAVEGGPSTNNLPGSWTSFSGGGLVVPTTHGGQIAPPRGWTFPERGREEAGAPGKKKKAAPVVHGGPPWMREQVGWGTASSNPVGGGGGAAPGVLATQDPAQYNTQWAGYSSWSKEDWNTAYPTDSGDDGGYPAW